MLDQLKRKQFNKKFKDEENPRNNFILSEHLAICNDANIKCKNHNVLAITMNDADQIIQKNILQANQNYIIFDSYRYLYESTKMELEKEGYLTKIIDFNHTEQSDQCNIFEYIHNAEDIEYLTSIILDDILYNADYKSNVVQSKSIMTSILRIILYYLGYECLTKRRNIMTIIELLKQLHPDNKDGRRRMEFKFEMVYDKEIKVLILKEWNSIKDNYSYEEQKQAFVNLAVYSNFIINCKEFQMLTCDNNLHLNEMENRKMAIFIEIGRAELFQEYMKSLFHFMLKEIFAEGKEQTYPVQIVFWNETFLGDYIGNLSEKFMNMDRYNIRYFCVVQSHDRLRFLFSKSKEDHNVLKTNDIDEETLNFFNIVIFNKNSYVDKLLTDETMSSDLKEYEKIISNFTGKKYAKKEIKQLRKISKDQCAVLARGERMVVDDIIN